MEMHTDLAWLTDSVPGDFRKAGARKHLMCTASGEARKFVIHAGGYLLAQMELSTGHFERRNWIECTIRGIFVDSLGVTVDLINSSGDTVGVFGIGHFLLMQAIVHAVPVKGMRWNVSRPIAMAVAVREGALDLENHLVETLNFGELVVESTHRDFVTCHDIVTGAKRRFAADHFAAEIQPLRELVEEASEAMARHGIDCAAHIECYPLDSYATASTKSKGKAAGRRS